MASPRTVLGWHIRGSGGGQREGARCEARHDAWVVCRGREREMTRGTRGCEGANDRCRVGSKGGLPSQRAWSHLRHPWPTWWWWWCWSTSLVSARQGCEASQQIRWLVTRRCADKFGSGQQPRCPLRPADPSLSRTLIGCSRSSRGSSPGDSQRGCARNPGRQPNEARRRTPGQTSLSLLVLRVLLLQLRGGEGRCCCRGRGGQRCARVTCVAVSRSMGSLALNYERY